MDLSTQTDSEMRGCKGSTAQPNKSDGTNAGAVAQESGVPTTDSMQGDEASTKGAVHLSASNGECKASGGDEERRGNNAHLGDGPAADCEDDDSVASGVENDPGELIGQKKKKKNRSRGNRRLGGLVGHKNANGFEGKSFGQVTGLLASDPEPEFYADPPVSPAEAIQEQELYSR